MDKDIKYSANIRAFTLVELIISIFISIILLWGVFYFMSETILGIARAGAQSRFLKDFYSFTTILDTGVLSIIHDYDTWKWFDVGLLTSIDGNSGILIGVVDVENSMLSQTGQIDIYHNTALGYRSLSSTELNDLSLDPNVVYSYEFFPDKIFSNFWLRDFQLKMYNSGAIMDMYLYINSYYKKQLNGENWWDVAQDELFEYSLSF